MRKKGIGIALCMVFVLGVAASLFAVWPLTINNVEDSYPDISGKNIVWQFYDGSHWQIMTFASLYIFESNPRHISPPIHYRPYRVPIKSGGITFFDQAVISWH